MEPQPKNRELTYMNYDFAALYPTVMKKYNIRPENLKIIRRKNKIKKIFNIL